MTHAVRPQSGNTFVGEFGAVLDGSGWRTTDPTQAAFRAHNEDVDDVTIRNLVVRNMPQKAIHAFASWSDRWTIEYTELTANSVGVSAPGGSVVRNNAIHDNASGGYAAYQGHGTRFEHNEIYRNGAEQKIVGADRVVFRNNRVHDNEADGIWYDTDATGAVIDGNTIEHNGRTGITYESSRVGTISRNTIRDNGLAGILIATSESVRIDGNTLQDNGHGIWLLLDCLAVRGGRPDLAENAATGNLVIVPGRAGALSNAFTYTPACGPSEVADYLSGSKHNVFKSNTYVVASVDERWWVWGTPKSWPEWQKLGHDQEGRVELAAGR